LGPPAETRRASLRHVIHGPMVIVLRSITGQESVTVRSRRRMRASICGRGPEPVTRPLRGVGTGVAGDPHIESMIERMHIGWLARLAAHDARALGYVVERRHPCLNRAVRATTRLGDPAIIVSIAALLLLGSSGEIGAAAVPAALALVISHILVQLLKRAVSRPRPRLPVGLVSLVEAPD